MTADLSAGEEPNELKAEDILLPASDHTKAKHRILKKYLEAWFPILSRYQGRVLYLDGFAGSGEYTDHTDGSPIIALEVARTHELPLGGELVFYFIELNDARFGHLREVLNKKYVAKGDGKYEKLPSNLKVVPINGDFNSNLKEILDGLKNDGKTLAPTIAFVDPFGYGELNVDLMSRVLSQKRCELLITYMVGFLNRFVFDESKWGAIRSALAMTDDEIRSITSVQDTGEREKAWLKKLTDKVVERTHASGATGRVYELYFRVMNRFNQTMYYLVFFTRSLAGMNAMKEAMWGVGSQGEYTFSDFGFVPGQTSILDYSKEKPWQAEAGRKVCAVFAGQKVLVNDIADWVIGDSPWIWRKGILKPLEEAGEFKVLTTRARRGTYPDGTILQFV
jgi:three-Cys-motif partner protein